MRLFIAVDFSSELKQQIYELQKELKNKSIKGRYKHIDNFHLTLKFLGEVNVNKITQLNKTLKSIADTSQKFNIWLDKLGCFGEKDTIRVIWLGIKGETEKLNVLHGKIENELFKIGFPKEKRAYSPHITIAQDVVFNTEFEKLKPTLNNTFKEVCVDKIVLMNSEQIEGKRVYTPIGEYILGK